MSIFDEAKKAAESAAERLLQEKTGMHVDLDGSDKAAMAATDTSDTTEDTTEDATETEVATPEPSQAAPGNNPLINQIMQTAEKAGMGMVEQKLNMDLDGDGKIGS